MPIEQPSLYPRWADDPPADTVTEPTEDEKSEGWQPPQAQVDAISIDVVADATLYRVQIAWPGQAALDCDFTSGAGATDEQVRDGLIAEINVVAGARVAASPDGSAGLLITANTPGEAFTATAATANLTRSEDTPNRTGRPRRQYMNWLSWLAYLWLVFLDAVRFRWSDVGDDWHVPGVGVLPTTGAGLAGTSGTATAYIEGRRVVGESEAHNYPASTDTYLDLTRDAVWVYSSVANNDPEPALTANSIRCFVVVTDATDRVSVEDRRGEHVRFDQQLDLHRTVRFGDARRGSLAQRAEARRQVRVADNGAGYTLIDEWINEAGTLGTRLYVRHSDGRAILVTGASWNGADWDVDSAALICELSVLAVTSASAMTGEQAIAFVPGGATFTDAEWYDALSAATSGTIDKVRYVEGTTDYSLHGNDYERARRPNHRNQISGVVRNLLHDDATSLGYAIPSGGGGTGGASRGTERAVNCTFDESTGQWSRDSAGAAYKIELSSAGHRLLQHPAADASPWDDTVSAGNWIEVVTLTDRLRTSVPIEPAAVTPALSGAAGTPDANTLYGLGIPKAWAYCQTDGAGGVTILAGYNLTAAISGNVIVFSFLRNMASANYAVLPHVMQLGEKAVAGSYANNQFTVTCEDELAAVRPAVQNVGAGGAARFFTVFVFGAQ